MGTTECEILSLFFLQPISIQNIGSNFSSYTELFWSNIQSKTATVELVKLKSLQN